jgi:AraC family transcriptional regulator
VRAMSNVGELEVADTLGILAMPGVKTQRTSQGLGWSGLLLSVQKEQPYEADFVGSRSHLVILHLDGPVQVTRGAGPRAQTRTIGAGGLFMHPAGRDLSVTLGGTLRTLHIYLDQAVLRRVAEEDVELAEEMGTTDPLLEHLLLSLDAVTKVRATASQLYVDSLSTAVAAQLVERHSSLRRTVLQRRSRGLPDRELRRATDLMHECMGETLPLSELASTVGLSESQFTRAFKARTGEPPHRYLMGLRVDHARRLLQTTELSIAEIASSCGFASQEHLTRVMRARLSTTPAALRRSFG